MFRIGQKVECIETWTHNGQGYGDEVGPVKGKIYTVCEIGVGINLGQPTQLQVRLIEITNRVRRYRDGTFEPAFRATRFRPVVERKTDISCFTEMLNPSSVTADAFRIADHARETIG